MAGGTGYEITQEIGVVEMTGSYSKEFNRVAFNGRESKYDIRSWYLDTDGVKKPTRQGVTLSYQGAKNLCDALCQEMFGFTILSAQLNEDGSVKVLPCPHDYDVGLHIPKHERDRLDNYVDDKIREEMERQFEEQMKADD